eukprot:365442-Chlamydomonas_euryale.AAC.21
MFDSPGGLWVAKEVFDLPAGPSGDRPERQAVRAVAAMPSRAYPIGTAPCNYDSLSLGASPETVLSTKLKKCVVKQCRREAFSTGHPVFRECFVATLHAALAKVASKVRHVPSRSAMRSDRRLNVQKLRERCNCRGFGLRTTRAWCRGFVFWRVAGLSGFSLRLAWLHWFHLGDGGNSNIPQ